MDTNRVFGRVAAGCFFTMLLPVSPSQSGQGAMAPRPDPCAVERESSGDLTFGAARELFPDSLAASMGPFRTSLDSIDAASPWLRGSFEPFPVDWMCRVEPTVEAPARPEQLPGAVQNLRRADQR